MELFVKIKILLAVLALLSVCAAVVFWFYSKRSPEKSFSNSKRNFHIPTEGVKKVVLENGMTVLMYQNTSQPKVLVQIAYNIGSSSEQEGERGLAHLLEHMIFKGTNKLSESDLDAIARKYGASYNAFTSMDVTSYYFETDKNNWQPFLSILADCMQNARFDEQHLNSELKAVLQELRMNKDQYWNMMFQKICNVLFPANHPYSHPIIGFKEDLMNISAQRVKSFYEKYYQPNRATLFVVGDFDYEEVVAQAKELFGSVKTKHEPIECEFPDLPPVLAASSIRTYEDVKTEQLGFFWRIPGAKDPQEIIGDAAAFLLAGGEGSRLYRTLVDEKKVAASVAVYSYTFMEAGIFWILIEPLHGKIDECRALVVQELNKAIEQGFSAHELEHMVRSQAKNFFSSLQKYKSIVYEWIGSFFATGNEYEFFKRAEKFASISSKQVQQFLVQNCDPLLMNQMDVVPMPEKFAKLSEDAKHKSDDLDRKILAKYVRTAPVEGVRFALDMPAPHPLAFSFPKPDRMVTLPNGLTVILKTNKTLPLVSVDCRFKEYFYLSSSQESTEMSLMMGALIEGSDGFTKNDNISLFEQYGASYGFGAEGASLSMLSDEYEKLLTRFVHILTKPSFPQDAIEKLKALQTDSFKRALDEPSQVAVKLLKSKIYAGHPFGWTFEDAIKKTAKADQKILKSLHDQMVKPNNMILTVVGDFDIEEMGNAINRIFASWQAGVEYEVVYPERVDKKQASVDVPMVRDQVMLIFGQASPINMYHEDLIPAKLLNYIMFYSLGSRLFKLREEAGLFYTAFGQLAAGAGQERGFDYVGALLSPENVVQSETKIKNLIEDARQGNITQSELDGAKRLYLKALLDMVASNSSVAVMLGMEHAWHLGFDYYDKALAKVQNMSLSEINAMAQKYCTTQNMMRVRVGRMPAQ